eukprot:4045709-Pleurochrysis_carterae.AAC.3
MRTHALAHTYAHTYTHAHAHTYAHALARTCTHAPTPTPHAHTPTPHANTPTLNDDRRRRPSLSRARAAAAVDLSEDASRLAIGGKTKDKRLKGFVAAYQAISGDLIGAAYHLSLIHI